VLEKYHIGCYVIVDIYKPKPVAMSSRTILEVKPTQNSMYSIHSYNSKKGIKTEKSVLKVDSVILLNHSQVGGGC